MDGEQKQHDSQPLPTVAPSITMQRADSVGSSRPTSGMNLVRTLHMLRSMLTDFLFEVELYPMLAVSRELHAVSSKAIAHLQELEKQRNQKLRGDIVRDLALIQAARAQLSPGDAAALNSRAFRLLECRVFYSSLAPQADGASYLTFAQLAELRSLVFAGAVVTGRDYEGFPILAKMLRHMLIKAAEGSSFGGEQPREGTEEECAWARELFQLCLLSNPDLCHALHGRHSATYYTNCVEEFDSMFISVLYLSRAGVRAGHVHLPSMMALADLCLWFVHLYHVTPLSEFDSQHRTPEEVIFDQCSSLIGCPPSLWRRSSWMVRATACAPRDNPPRLRQMRWNILRACTRGGEAYGREIVCHVPLLDSRLHPHPLMLCEDQWPEDAVCAVCGLGELRTAYTCSPCKVRVHAACASPHQSQASSAAASSASAVSAPAQPPPPSEWFYEHLATSSTEFLQAMWSGHPHLLGVLMHSNAAFWLRLRLSLLQHCKLARSSYAYSWKPKVRPSQGRSCLDDWINGALRDPTTRRTFTTILTHHRFSAIVEQMREDDGTSKPSYLLQALFFELLRRKERSILQRWISAERTYFLVAWPRLVEFASGLSPLHFLCARVRGCRQHLFQLLLQLTCESLSIPERAMPPADALTLRCVSGETVRDLLSLPRNRDLWDAVEGSSAESREETE